jgi:hypothetical protein
VAEALAAPACELPLADVGTQGEAVAFTADGRGYVTLAEGRSMPLYFYAFGRP